MGFRLSLRGVTLLNCYIAAVKVSGGAWHQEAEGVHGSKPCKLSRTKNKYRQNQDDLVSSTAELPSPPPLMTNPAVLLPFDELYQSVGFNEAYEWERSSVAHRPSQGGGTSK
eukprot:768522-Hanusia_phi.AAC.8